MYDRNVILGIPLVASNVTMVHGVLQVEFQQQVVMLWSGKELPGVKSNAGNSRCASTSDWERSSSTVEPVLLMQTVIEAVVENMSPDCSNWSFPEDLSGDTAVGGANHD